jgi:uncharacterized protein
MTASRLSLIESRTVSAFLIALLCLAAQPANAGPAYINLGGGGEYSLQVKSLVESRFRNVVRQRYDYSCGSAAIATLLTHHYDYPIDEMDVLQAMFENGDQEKIRKEGFSMLDMKDYLTTLGYEVNGYRESLSKLSAVGIPAIVLINRKGYMHFVVVKGVSKEKVAVGDPTLGLRIYDRDDFEKMWNGILFVVLNDKHIAKKSFNVADNWSINGTPNFRNMLDRGELGTLTIDTSYTPNYY